MFQIITTFKLSWSEDDGTKFPCGVVLILGGEGSGPCLADRFGSNFVSNFGSYFEFCKSFPPGKERGGKWGASKDELNAEVNIGGWGTKLGEKVADEEFENGRDGIEVGDIQGDAEIFEKTFVQLFLNI